MTGAWKTREGLEVETVGKNMFLFKFECKKDRKWVLKNGPWFFDKQLLILEEPTAKLRTTEVELKNVAFWVRFINLPMGYRNKRAAEKLGNDLGQFLEVDCDKDEQCWGNNMRMKVLLDISKPLRRGFMLKSDEISNECQVSIRYERLPEFCFKCGWIEHVAKECEEEEEKQPTDETRYEFGPWMRFQGPLRTGKKPEDPMEAPMENDQNTESQNPKVPKGLENREVNSNNTTQEIDILASLNSERMVLDRDLVGRMTTENQMHPIANSFAVDLNINSEIEGPIVESGNMTCVPDTVYSGAASFSGKKQSWKRKVRSDLIMEQRVEDDEPNKRKRSYENDKKGKRVKLTDDMEMEANAGDEIWAVAEKQPCQGP